jgi:DNA anti-recombination protein RmuC
MEYQHSTGAHGPPPGSSGWSDIARRIGGSALLVAALFALGCGNDQPPPRADATASDAKQPAGEAPAAAARIAQQEKSEFLQATQQEMEQIKLDLAALKRDAELSHGAAKQKLERQVRDLEEKWDALEAQVAALREQSAETWTDMRQQVLAALADLKQSYLEVRRAMEG